MSRQAASQEAQRSMKGLFDSNPANNEGRGEELRTSEAWLQAEVRRLQHLLEAKDIETQQLWSTVIEYETITKDHYDLLNRHHHLLHVSQRSPFHSLHSLSNSTARPYHRPPLHDLTSQGLRVSGLSQAHGAEVGNPPHPATPSKSSVTSAGSGLAAQDGTDASDVSSLTGILGRSQHAATGGMPIDGKENAFRLGSLHLDKGSTSLPTSHGQDPWQGDACGGRRRSRRPQPADSLGLRRMLHQESSPSTQHKDEQLDSVLQSFSQFHILPSTKSLQEPADAPPTHDTSANGSRVNGTPPAKLTTPSGFLGQPSWASGERHSASSTRSDCHPLERIASPGFRDCSTSADVPKSMEMEACSERLKLGMNGSRCHMRSVDGSPSLAQLGSFCSSPGLAGVLLRSPWTIPIRESSPGLNTDRAEEELGARSAGELPVSIAPVGGKLLSNFEGDGRPEEGLQRPLECLTEGSHAPYSRAALETVAYPLTTTPSSISEAFPLNGMLSASDSLFPPALSSAQPAGFLSIPQLAATNRSIMLTIPTASPTSLDDPIMRNEGTLGSSINPHPTDRLSLNKCSMGIEPDHSFTSTSIAEGQARFPDIAGEPFGSHFNPSPTPSATPVKNLSQHFDLMASQENASLQGQDSRSEHGSESGRPTSIGGGIALRRMTQLGGGSSGLAPGLSSTPEGRAACRAGADTQGEPLALSAAAGQSSDWANAPASTPATTAAGGAQVQRESAPAGGWNATLAMIKEKAFQLRQITPVSRRKPARRIGGSFGSRSSLKKAIRERRRVMIGSDDAGEGEL